MRKEIMERDDEYVANVDTNAFADYLVSQLDLPLLVVRDGDTKFEESRELRTDRGRFGDAIHREIPVIIVRLPLEPAERIEDVLSLMPSTYSTDFPEFDLDDYDIVGEIRNPTSDEVGAWIGKIKTWCAFRNDDVKRMSPELRATAVQLIEQRKRVIGEKRTKFDEISKTLGVPLKRKDAPKAVPTLSMRRSITAKRVPPEAKRPEEYRLSAEDLSGVIDEILRICRPWEVTPDVYSRMEEEHLRDIIVGQLNHVYDVGGVATGEAFRKQGKTDIQLVINPGAVFTAECKWWSGSKAYTEALEQLFGYVTWRQNDAALVTFVREKGFTDVVASAREASNQHTSRRGTIKSIGESHFVSEHARPEDEQHILNVHHLLFTLPRRT